MKQHIYSTHEPEPGAAASLPACRGGSPETRRQGCRRSQYDFSRREFLTTSGLAVLGLAAQGCATVPSSAHADPIIDIHQHVGYSGRPDDVLLAHQRARGVTTTILLPAG